MQCTCSPAGVPVGVWWGGGGGGGVSGGRGDSNAPASADLAWLVCRLCVAKIYRSRELRLAAVNSLISAT